MGATHFRSSTFIFNNFSPVMFVFAQISWEELMRGWNAAKIGPYPDTHQQIPRHSFCGKLGISVETKCAIMRRRVIRDTRRQPLSRNLFICLRKSADCKVCVGLRLSDQISREEGQVMTLVIANAICQSPPPRAISNSELVAPDMKFFIRQKSPDRVEPEKGSHGGNDLPPPL